MYSDGRSVMGEKTGQPQHKELQVSTYTVEVEGDVPPNYKVGYFPRCYRYLADAVAMVDSVVSDGAKCAYVTRGKKVVYKKEKPESELTGQ